MPSSDPNCVDIGEPSVGCRIKWEVITRTQGKLEMGLDFLDSVIALWARVDDPLPLKDQLDFAYNGLRPEYHQKFERHDFNNFDELYENIRAVDIPRQRLQRRELVPMEQSVVPENAYQPENYESKKRVGGQVTAIADPPKEPREMKKQSKSGQTNKSDQSKGQVAAMNSRKSTD